MMKAARIPMMAMMMRSSIRVKARFIFDILAKIKEIENRLYIIKPLIRGF